LKVRDLLTLFLWSIMLSSVTLTFSFFMSEYFYLSYFFWIVTGLFAGLLIVDLKRVVFCSILSYFLSSVFMFLFLSLPVFLGTLSHQVLGNLVYGQNLKLVFSLSFPFMLLTNIVSSIIGGYIGEILLASYS